MTRAVLCVGLAGITLLVGLLTAKLCAGNAARGEALYRLHLANEMQAAHIELLSADVESHLPPAPSPEPRRRVPLQAPEVSE